MIPVLCRIIDKLNASFLRPTDVRTRFFNVPFRFRLDLDEFQNPLNGNEIRFQIATVANQPIEGLEFCSNI